MTDYRSMFYKRILYQSFYFEMSNLIQCVTVLEGDSLRRLETTVDVYLWQQRQYGEWQFPISIDISSTITVLLPVHSPTC